MFDPESKPPSGWRRDLYEVLFETDTPGGYAFDVALLVAIVGSVLVVTLESVAEIREGREQLFFQIEWGFTLLFSVEYVLRVVAVHRKRRYVLSFFGIVDVLSIVPTYLAVFLSERAASYTVIRVLRLLRVFRVLKLGHFLREGGTLFAALSASRYRISVFVGAVLAIATVMGALLHVIEGPEHGFTSIPVGVYWAIVTLTTVGYGDISPQTALGQAIASLLMVLGYGIIAVPTGIVTVELGKQGMTDAVSERSCESCAMSEHRRDAVFCRGCGARLPDPTYVPTTRSLIN